MISSASQISRSTVCFPLRSAGNPVRRPRSRETASWRNGLAHHCQSNRSPAPARRGPPGGSARRGNAPGPQPQPRSPQPEARERAPGLRGRHAGRPVPNVTFSNSWTIPWRWALSSESYRTLWPDRRIAPSEAPGTTSTVPSLREMEPMCGRRGRTGDFACGRAPVRTRWGSRRARMAFG
jgi:hypothetical protein